MKIGIDAGHGGRDPGAVNGRIYEKVIVLPISLHLKNLLTKAGFTVYMTRDSDLTISLKDRTNYLNMQNVDLAISIHINASGINPQADYIATFIQGRGGEAEKLADKVQTELVKATGWTDGRVRVQNLHMTRETKMPTILVECGFISNNKQAKQLIESKTQYNIANAIYLGIMKYLGKEVESLDKVKIKFEIPTLEGVLIDGVTHIPLRQILERQIVWDGDKREVVIR